MIDLEDINHTIEKLEQGRTNTQNCALLASLYIVRDHLEGVSREPNKTLEVAANKESHVLNKMKAERWTANMENEDGTKGPHWTMDQTKQVQAQRNINCDPVEFYAIINSIYSDYCKVAKKHNVNTIDFYADMAKAWLDDEDAVNDKATAYFEYIVKH